MQKYSAFGELCPELHRELQILQQIYVQEGALIHDFGDVPTAI